MPARVRDDSDDDIPQRRRNDDGLDASILIAETNAHEYRAKEVAQAVLACHNTKNAAKEPEIRKLLTKDDLAHTEDVFRKVFGVQLDKLGDRLFLSMLPSASVRVQDYPKELQEEAKQGLLIVVLVFLYISKNPILSKDRMKDLNLWDFLAMLGVEQEKNHTAFGLPSKLIAPNNMAEFVAQGWISFEKVSTCGDADEVFYDLGPRTLASVDPKELLETFCEMIGDDKVKWKEHYAKARRDQARQDDEREDARDKEKKRMEKKTKKKQRRAASSDED